MAGVQYSVTLINKMTEKSSFEETLRELEKFIYLKIPKEQRPSPRDMNVMTMKFFVEQLKIDLSKLKVIHIAGTKGKGSTCSFIECILRKQGYKTGLYTKPHLFDIRERYRINGEMISKKTFVDAFWKLYNGIEKEFFKKNARYGRILTTMMFLVFLEKKVDVCIIEVGCGGLKDSTNVCIPTICGFTHIGLDHTNILGDTVEEIALNKSGIIKPNAPVFTYQQDKKIIDVLEKAAKEKNVPFFIVPKFSQIIELQSKEIQKMIHLKMEGEHQKLNAANALLMCDLFVKMDKNEKFDPKNYNPSSIRIQKNVVNGLNSCLFSGRGHVISFEEKKINFLLDGAHTTTSMKFCRDWFVSVISSEANSIVKKSRELKIEEIVMKQFQELANCLKKLGKNKVEEKTQNMLVFFFTGKRNPSLLIDQIIGKCSPFDFVFFVPLDSSKENLERKKNEGIGKIVLSDQTMKKIERMKICWNENKNGTKTKVGSFSSINEFLGYLWGYSNVNVLVTVGDFILKLSSLKVFLK